MLNAREKPHFPPLEAASSDGVLLVGGSLAPDWMLEAYRRGIFPMPIKIERHRHIAWLAPDPRGILEFDSLHVSRRLARRLRQGEFQFTLDTAFAEVVEACAAPRGHDDDCWLTLSMQNAYLTLHQLGHAHSIEVWRDGNLRVGLDRRDGDKLRVREDHDSGDGDAEPGGFGRGRLGSDDGEQDRHTPRC